MPMIDILLATYNGARFLPELLRSVEMQTFTDWRLVVRDDGSTDGSLAIVEDWASRTRAPVWFVDDGRKGLGASGNFGALLEASDAPWFALCDQDDVWLPGKLALMLKHLTAAEVRHGKDVPLLAYSDLRVVDERLQVVHSSFRTFYVRQVPRSDRPLVDIMTQNIVAGCASLGNAALRQVALPIPPEAVMHDWWLALTAAAMGALIDVPEATILYRQHGGNATDAVDWTLGAILLRVIADFGGSLRNVRSFIADTQRQALAFHGRFEKELDAATGEVVRQYGLLHAQSTWKRKNFACHNLRKSRRFLRNVALLAFM